MDSKDFETASGKLVQYIIEYRNGANKRKFSVLPDLEKIKPGYLQRLLPNRAPENKEQFDEILQDIRQKIIPGVTHWQHPDFHAFYPTCTSYPTMLGDLLAAAIGCVGFTWLACPACTELEVITLDWLVHALKLPEKFLSATGKRDPSHTGGGVIELSASMACATLTMGLRDRMLRNYIKDPHSLSEDDHLKGNGPGSLVDRMVAYTSDQAHSSVSRAFRIAMVNSRIIKSKRCGRRLVFDPVDLRRAIEKDLEKGFIPLMCVATMGTTSTCEFEDLQGIGQVCNDYGIWFHVDAAYGGIALLCPELRHLSRGIELADSVNINAHKMMMVNVDSSPLWLSDHRVLTEAFEANPLYLHHAYGGMPDYRKWSLSLARGFRSLKLWFVLRTYGLSGLREMTRHHVELAKHFERLLTEDGRFHITNDVQFGLVCFQLKNDNSLTVALHDELMKKGDIFLVLGSTEISGEEGDEAVEAVSTEIVFLRFVCIHGTTMDDVEFAYERISAAASYILEGNDEGNGGVVTKGTR